MYSPLRVHPEIGAGFQLSRRQRASGSKSLARDSQPIKRVVSLMAGYVSLFLCLWQLFELQATRFL